MSIPGKRTYEVLADFHPDIIHVSNPALTGVIGMGFGRRLGIPVIASFQAHVMQMARFYGLGLLESPLWWLHRQVYRRADAVIAPSKRIAAELEAHNFGPVGLWRRGVQWDRFSPALADPALREMLTDSHPERVLLLSVGRLAPEKQVEHLVPVLDAVPNVHLAIVGDGPHRDKLEQVFAGKPVTFTGYKTGDELNAIYASADVFMFPSSPIETFGLVAAEAMASGLPVIASRVGGMPEIVEDGVTGFIHESGDTEAIVAAVRMLAADPDRRRAMSQAARHAAEHWSWTEVMDELFEKYRAVIADYHARPQ